MKYIYIILTTAVPIAIFVYASDHKVFSSQSPPTSFQTGCLGPACFWMGRQQGCHYPGVCWFCWVVAVVCFFVVVFGRSKHLQDQPIWAWWFHDYPEATKKLEAPRKLGDFEGRGGWPQAYEFLEVGRLHPWMFDLWNLFYGGKFCNAVTYSYKFVFWNLWNLVNPFITVWTWHTKSIGLRCLSFGRRWI